MSKLVTDFKALTLSQQHEAYPATTAVYSTVKEARHVKLEQEIRQLGFHPGEAAKKPAAAVNSAAAKNRPNFCGPLCRAALVESRDGRKRPRAGKLQDRCVLNHITLPFALRSPFSEHFSSVKALSPMLGAAILTCKFEGLPGPWHTWRVGRSTRPERAMPRSPICRLRLRPVGALDAVKMRLMRRGCICVDHDLFAG